MNLCITHTGNDMLSSAVEILSQQILPNCRCLTDLLLDDNEIGSDGIISISKALWKLQLKNECILKNLSAEFCTITAAGAIVITRLKLIKRILDYLNYLYSIYDTVLVIIIMIIIIMKYVIILIM